jgi:methylmalonyl-CoA mutase cobalamin-binding subunit
MRRIIMGMGVELIHLGHSRSIEEVVTDLREDAEGIEVGGRCSLKQSSIALHEEADSIGEICRRSP